MTEHSFQEQLERIDRLMRMVESDNAHSRSGGLTFEDIVLFACQAIWHLKDWVLNDRHFGAKDLKVLQDEIHRTPCLILCSDIANGSKHLLLKKPKVGGQLSERTGMHMSVDEGIFKEFYYVACSDPTDALYGIEIRELLRLCRDTWQDIINRHHLTQIDEWLAQQADAADGHAPGL